MRQRPRSDWPAFGWTRRPAELDEFKILLSSPETAAVLDKKYNLLHDVFKSAWDSKNNRWYPPGWKDRLHYGIVEALSGVAHEDTQRL